ncbi:hypothetical protein ACWEOE_17620 [Amycolatopsis sp. NPDC004368]
MDLLHGVEVEMRRTSHFGQQPRHLPPRSGQPLGDDLLLRHHIAVVVGQRLGREPERHPQFGVVVHRVDGAAGLAVAEPDLPVVQVEDVGRGEDRQVLPEVLREALFGPKLS